MKRLSSSILLILIAVIGCSKIDKIPSSVDLLDRTDKGEVKQLSASPPVAETIYERPAVPTGYSPSLLLGDHEGYMCKFLIHFPVAIDTAKLEAATLFLYPDTTYGQPNTFMMKIRRIDIDWSERGVTWGNFDTSGAVEPVADLNYDPSAEELVIPLDTALVRAWMIDTTLTNEGLLFDHDGAAYIQQFYSQESASASSRPKLELIFSRGVATDTTYYQADADAFIVDYNAVFESDLLFVSNATGWRSIVQFDLSAIPAEATINRARLEVWLNSTATAPTTRLGPYGIDIGVQTISSATWAPDAITIDSTLYAPYGTVTADSSKLLIARTTELADLTTIIQKWSSGELQNRGLILYSLYEGWDINQVTFYGSNADSSLRPRLTVEYTIPPKYSK